ncbi:hypothetical protein EW145_g2390 [Phellinidium pouzarii]|uniref:Amidohydrolase-related domain-containing protein n=1 Tax=Phellinidium pouzarii TaxID=167371 RepID=A0A4S4LCK4_9AGAM|nr:hypothetical protein EW145_g2390 [Phellinidium pouzarii]
MLTIELTAASATLISTWTNATSSTGGSHLSQGTYVSFPPTQKDRKYPEDIVSSDFAEALKVTSDVKATFKDNAEDLYARGNRLVHASVEAGVTSMRAHVEVDNIVNDACLKVGLKLRDKWTGICDIQIAVFMQDPIFNKKEDTSPGINASILANVLRNDPSLTVIGSAPYVERTRAQQLANIDFILSFSIQHNLHVDFHLDYDLTPLPSPGSPSSSEPLIYHLLTRLTALHWAILTSNRLITIGHFTRLSLFSPTQLADLRARIADLPVHIVGLPQSDLYMMGRDHMYLRGIPRGTLNVCALRAEHGFNAVMAVNNVGNAFTPQGVPDPLALCTLGVAVYQDGTPSGCKHLLVKAVSIDSRRAIGDIPSETSALMLIPQGGSPADFVILHGNHTLQSAVLDPSYDRTTIKSGKVVAWRKGIRDRTFEIDDRDGSTETVTLHNMLTLAARNTHSLTHARTTATAATAARVARNSNSENHLIYLVAIVVAAQSLELPTLNTPTRLRAKRNDVSNRF